MKPTRLAEQPPIEKFPLKGSAGWSVQLDEKGNLLFVIGSVESHTSVVAPNAYQPGQLSSVVCIFNKGTASIYLNGNLIKTQDKIEQTTTDKTAPGCLGIYWTRNNQAQSFDGELGDVKVFNRALSTDELQHVLQDGK